MKSRIQPILRPAWLILLLCAGWQMLCAITVAFDLTKEETAGNADWTIGSSPSWIGAYSDFGAALRNLGYTTTTLSGSSITASALANVDVLVIPEPQNQFSASERSVLTAFVQSGGGLFLIADHEGSDRNNNGWDSRRVYNESLLSAQNFGISFDANSIYADPTSIIETPSTQITNGLSQVGMYAGCSITPSNGAVCHIWLRNSSEKGLVTNTYGQGRVAAYGDSSPFDDGTGHSGNELYDGWHDYDNAQMGVNVVEWLAGTVVNPVTFSSVNILPTNPVVGQAVQVRATITAAQSFTFVYLYWKTTGGFNPVLMSNTGSLYTATIPAQALPITVQYYIQARTTSNVNGYYPAEAPNVLASYQVSPSANDDETIVPMPFSLYPNPALLSHTTVKIHNPLRESIDIFNIHGALIRTLPPASTQWNGRDRHNHSVPEGVYLFRSTTHTAKLLLQR